MFRLTRWLRWSIILFIAIAIVGVLALGEIYVSVSSQLPDVHSLRDIVWQEPMYVFASDGKLMAVFGETRRYPIKISEVPPKLKDAFLATEDAHFYTHGGVDYRGILRAIWLLATTRAQRVPGGSTITQQVAREFFLTSDYSYRRKFAEILLARKIESVFTKDQILEIYLNKTFFGNRAYGIGAAAEYYYGKTLDQLDLDEMASLAGIPKFPSSANPISNPERARQRRDNYVLQRMEDLGFISQTEAVAAMHVPMHASPHEPSTPVYAPYAAEMVRQHMIAQFGPSVLDQGYRIYTTIDPRVQTAAYTAVRSGLSLYDHRHGWSGTEGHLNLQLDATDAETEKRCARALAHRAKQGNLAPVVVTQIHLDGSIVVVQADGHSLHLPSSAAQWTGKPAGKLVRRGDIVRLHAHIGTDKKPAWILDQLPRAQAALVSMDARDGAIQAIVGGFSFAENKFNRATQARRQPGSTFKPFIYAAAFENGFLPSSIVLDAPVVFRQANGQDWSPQNDDSQFLGPMVLRDALIQSRNLVSVRLLDAIGLDFARKYVTNFGFDQADLPNNLSMALGTASLTPLSIARGYSVFVNGGYQVNPWFIKRIEDRNGHTVFQATPSVACSACGPVTDTVQPATPQDRLVDGFNFEDTTIPTAPRIHPAGVNDTTPAQRGQGQQTTQSAGQQLATQSAKRVIDPRVAFQIVSLLREVVTHGTGVQARVLGRSDIGGKTGSTNDYRDAWFSGFGGHFVTTVWVGRDDSQGLGHREYGGKAALPIWIDYMRVALEDRPVMHFDPPAGMTQTTVNGVTEWVKDEDIDHLQDHDQDIQQDQNEEQKVFDIF